MYALWHRRKKQFLVIEAEKEQVCDYDGSYTRAYLQIRDSDFHASATLFVTENRRIAQELKKTGKYSEDIRLNLGWGLNKIELSDLEVVRLSKAKKRKRKKVC